MINIVIVNIVIVSSTLLGVLEGKLYVAGGECKGREPHGTTYLNSVEVYDKLKNTWNYTAAMKLPRSFAASTVMGGEWRC